MSDAKPNPQAGCGGHEAPALSVVEARSRIAEAVQPVDGFERLALRSALGRMLAEDVRSPINVPSHRNSAMDGYAIKASDLAGDGDVKLTVIGTSWAGTPFAGALETGQCVRIMTGAVVPDGADTVIMQERVERRGDAIRVVAEHRRGDNVRAAGEDLTKDQVMLACGKQLLPPELGLLASVGIAEVTVRRRVRVAFFSTGDELRSIGQVLAPGEIYDSNRYTLYGALVRLGAEILDMGVVRDDREATKEAFIQAASNAD
ncbi:MAG: molybdopterin molybdotransferase MoeA, partial [Acidiferrobacterales bacterium]